MAGQLGRGGSRRAGRRRAVERGDNARCTPGVHRASHRGEPPVDPDQAAARRRCALRAHDTRHRRPGEAGPHPRRGDRSHLADRRAAPATSDTRRRGAQRRLLPAGSRRRDAARSGRRPCRRAAAARRRPGRRRRAAHVRHLDRRRPRRQPERHGRRHARGTAVAASRRGARRHARHRRPDRRAVVVHCCRRRIAGTARLDRGRPGGAARDRPAARHAQCHRAVPAQAHRCWPSSP